MRRTSRRIHRNSRRRTSRRVRPNSRRSMSLRRNPVNPRNLAIWVDTYEKELLNAVRNHPEKFAYGEQQVPAVAKRMAAAFQSGSFNHDGLAIKNACRVLGIKHTRKAINEFLNG